MIKKNVKCIWFAYPSSVIAKKYGFAKDGCWYLFVGDEEGDCSVANIVHVSPLKEEVIERSHDYRCPWGNYSMVKE